MSDRAVIFIDNSNVYKHLADLHKVDPKWCKLYDPKHLGEKLVGNRELTRILFYCSPPPQRLQQTNAKAYNIQIAYFDAVKKIDKLDLKYGTLKLNQGVLVEKNLDTQLTSDVLRMAAQNEFDVAIIVTNDGDYVSPVESLKSFGKKVEVAYFRQKVSMDLKRASDVSRRLRLTYFKRLNFDLPSENETPQK